MQQETAFPTEESNYEKIWSSPGMTLRDYFSAKAMATLCNGLTPEAAAKEAYEYADAMIRAREES